MKKQNAYIRTTICVLMITACLSAHAQTKGRYVHIYLPGAARTLSLSEVQVISGEENVALRKNAIQTSTAYESPAKRAVDGNTSTRWGDKSITHTEENKPNPAWEVDLGQEFEISSIKIWNRDSYEDRLNGVQLLILNKDRVAVWGQAIANPPANKLPAIAVTGKGNSKDVGKKFNKVVVLKKKSTNGSQLEDAKNNNAGILNGPLTDRNLGHKARNEGTQESLKLAINHLIKTYGEKYPKGKEFLERLEGANMDNPESSEFTALKREALVIENPAIDFENILLVKAKSTERRYSNNWETRTTCKSGKRKWEMSDVTDSIHNYAIDKDLEKIRNEKHNLKRVFEKKQREVRESKAFKESKERRDVKDKMFLDTPEHNAYQQKGKELHEAAMKFPKYAEAHARLGTEVSIHEDKLVVMPIKGDGSTKTVYESKGALIADVDLHFDADKIIFSSIRDRSKLSEGGKGYQDKTKGYSVYELQIDPKTGETSSKPVDIIPDMGRDNDAYDACYLPDGRILFISTASYEGVPCVGGGSYVGNLFRMKRDGTEVRRLTFEQDGNWNPSVLENGRIMYLRWEYTDSAHYFSRVLMTMNPDGTDQKAHYGSNSYWPNSMFHARQIPGNSTKFISTITGHHSNSKGGALGIFDVSKGRFEADGAVQLLTARGKKVHPLVLDGLHGVYAPMFYNPYPINDKFFLTTTQDGSLYMVDVFDNMVCLKKSEEGERYFEPVPLRITKTPHVMMDRINMEKKEATVLINDIYFGPGLKGVPRGTVKDIRVYRYEYGPRHRGGHYAMGMEAGWDAKQILGTAPVEEDGSANFIVPANTPFSMQPLDKDGKALALMRSWTVAMPGERLSCIGCHESQNSTPPVKAYKAMRREPSTLKPFYGPTRGFSYEREVQPIIDKYCVSCHDGKPANDRYIPADRLVGTDKNEDKSFAEVGIPDFTHSRSSRRAIHPFVRRNGPEGDYHVLTPLEFHVDTSELFQMLDKGHHNVKLDKESMDKLITWADINAPYHGTWTEEGAKVEILNRRKELRKKYAFVDYDPEIIVNPYVKGTEIVMPEPLERNIVEPKQSKIGKRGKAELTLDLGNNIKMKFANIPAGIFSMGSNDETPMEQPVTRVKIKKPFLMGVTEVTLAQYRQFDPDYLNGVYDMHFKDQVHRGYYMNDMKFPVIRVPWTKAVEFCKWLSEKTGKKVSLPTEAQWEWACRAGTSSPLSFGDLNSNFSGYANLADATVVEMAVSGVNPKPINNPNKDMDFELKDKRSNDNVLHLAKVGSYSANAWGLFDMHGNVAEWTSSDYKAYPYKSSNSSNKKVVRGGSWKDRMYRSTSSYRLGFPKWQKVFNTGFRVVIEE